MSLQVWLPLTGNLNNNGVSGTIVTNYNVTFDTSGKLGSCALISTAGNKLTVPNPINTTTDEFSVSCWFYITQFTNGYACLCCDRTQTSGKGIAFWILPSSMRFDDGEMWSFAASTSLNTWYHLCITWSKTKGKYVYVNGTQIAYKASVGTLGDLTSTLWIAESMQNASGSYSLVGKLNDFRIYDHTLSIKEIKELAKGLVVHYPLTGNVGTYNLVKGSNTDSVNTNKLMLSQQYGGSTKTIEYDGGVPCIKIIRNTTEQSGWNVLYYQYLESANIKVDTTYTISFDIIGSGNGNISLYGLRFANSTNELCRSVSIINNTFTTTEWSHIVFNTTTKTSFDGLTISDQVVYMVCPLLVNTEAWVMVKNFKVEEGTVDTPWNPNPADSSYSIYNGDSGQVIDISGYNNHAEIIGSPENVIGSPRYNIGVNFTTTSDYIKLLNLSTTGFTNTYTFSWWGRYTTNYTGHMMWGFANGNRLNLYMANSGKNFYWNTGDSLNNPFGSVKPSEYRNEWHHFVVTGDGTTNKFYIDGEFQANATTYRAITGTHIILNGWDTSVNYKFNGSLSDFRVYATCLSDNDIKELYNTPINISNSGDLFTQGEFVEGDQTVKFGKNGVISASGQVKPNLVSGTNRGEVNSSGTSVSDGIMYYGSGGNGTCSVSASTDVPVGNYSYDIVGNTSGNRDFQQRAMPYKAGKLFTGSWWAKGSGTCLYRVWDVTTSHQLMQKTFTLTSDWAFYSHTFEATQEMEDDNCTFHLGLTGNSEIHLCGMKLEENDHPTPWTYNKYDAGFDIDNNFVEENAPTIGNQNYITAKELKEI